VLSKLSSMADRELTVLILGESGTGKEHLAKALHEASPRRAGPFVPVNCSTVLESMIEAELFGHKKGSFSDAHADREGLFQAANGGTLLLDEIGDAPQRVQYALLRALQERAVRPVGGRREEPVDVRVMAATSRDVRQLIAEQKLREDLYFRLAELTVTVPPLRERLVDLPQIAESLLDGLGCEKPLTKSALAKLKRHHWQGNVRELKNALNRAFAASGDSRTLGAELFVDLDLLSLPPRRDPPPFEFPDLVRGLGAHAVTVQSLPALPTKSQYEQRALQRATLLYLSELYATLPTPFVVFWERLFGPRWATTEQGRGLKDVLRVLGRTATDRAAREWVLTRAG
jgi:two-component system response regulator PilR (NtrC family)